MTTPGSIIPPQPGWWPRTSRVGVATSEYGWESSMSGLILPAGVAAGGYGWDSAATGTRPLEFMGATSAVSSSVALPTHQVGDIICIFAYRAGSTTPPDKPAASGTVPAWEDIDAATGSDDTACRTVKFVATATNHTSGTFTNAHAIAAAVCRDQDVSAPIGGHAESGGSNDDTADAPSISLEDTSGRSILIHFIGKTTVAGFTAWGSAPSGYTRRSDAYVNHAVCVNTKDVTTSDGACVQSVVDGNVNGRYRGATIEIKS